MLQGAGEDLPANALIELFMQGRAAGTVFVANELDESGRWSFL
jgi:hypothetical protein